MTRMFPPLVKGQSPYFLFVDRCKKGGTLGLKHPREKELFMEMVKKADLDTLNPYGPQLNRYRCINPT